LSREIKKKIACQKEREGTCAREATGGTSGKKTTLPTEKVTFHEKKGKSFLKKKGGNRPGKSVRAGYGGEKSGKFLLSRKR